MLADQCGWDRVQIVCLVVACTHLHYSFNQAIPNTLTLLSDAAMFLIATSSCSAKAVVRDQRFTEDAAPPWA